MSAKEATAAESLLNEAQRRRLLASARHADKLLGEIEQILHAAEAKSAFPRYRPDLAPHQARLLENQIARFRGHLAHVLAAAGVRQERPPVSALDAVRVTLAFVRIAVQEMAPEQLRGYGALSEAPAAELRGLCSELEGILSAIERNLALGARADLAARIDRLDPAVEQKELLRRLDRAVTECELAEFRAPLLELVERAESQQFEIAVFGRVSSGKSSLLNHILGAEILPVGVNPITAVPVRLLWGPEDRFRAILSGGQIAEGELGRLAAFASEEHNAGNELGVTRLEVWLPAARLKGGLVFVDTPGLGALATAGAAETLAYLPRCDLGIVLVSAATPINDEDLGVIESLAHAGIPARVVLSKADLAPPPELEKALAYTRRQIEARLGRALEPAPVSIRPGYEALLDRWFTEHLAPLEGRHQELVRESLRRKAGALRDRIVAALQAAIGEEAAGLDPGGLDSAERSLREAAGAIDEARRSCLQATDRVRRLGIQAIDRAARELAHGREPSTQAATVLARITAAAAAEAASELAGRLRALARQLEAACRQASEALSSSPALPDGSLEELIRELPRWELTLEGFAVPSAPSPLPSPLARTWRKRRLRAQAGERLEAAFTQYGRALERWLGERLAELQERFEAEADSLRAQLVRLADRAALPPEKRARIAQILDELEAGRLSSPARSPAPAPPEVPRAVPDQPESAAPR